MFGGTLGPLAAIHQRGIARPATKRVITHQDEALPVDEVVKIIDGAVASHNGALIAIVPPFKLPQR